MNYGLWGILMGQCRYIGCHKCATPSEDDGDGGGYARDGWGHTQNLFTVPSVLLQKLLKKGL